MDFSFAEIAIILVVALLVVGPDKLPGLARTIGLWVGKARRFIDQVKSDIDAEIKADEIKKAISNNKKSMHEISEIFTDARDDFQQSVHSMRNAHIHDNPEYQVKAIADEDNLENKTESSEHNTDEKSELQPKLNEANLVAMDEEADDAHHEIEDDFKDDYDSDYQIDEIETNSSNKEISETAVSKQIDNKQKSS